MIAKAYISHQMPHRVRIRIPSEKKKNKYFSCVKRELEKLDGVESVEVQPFTGSVLVRHRCPLRSLFEFTRSHDLFEVEQRRPKRPWVHGLFSKVDEWNEELRHSTDGQWDLPTLAAVGVLGISLYQASKKELFPPAWTLLGDAVNLLAQAHRSAPLIHAVR